jgi:hypothetical protein
MRWAATGLDSVYLIGPGDQAGVCATKTVCLICLGYCSFSQPSPFQLLSTDAAGFSLFLRLSVLLVLLPREVLRPPTLSPVRRVTGEADLLPAELLPCLTRRLREPEELEESVELSESESEEESPSLSLEEESDPDLQNVFSCLAW